MNKFSQSSNIRFIVYGLLLLLLGIAVRLYNISSLELSYFDEGAYILEAARMFHREPSTDYYYARPGFDFLLGLTRFFVDDPALAGRLLSALGFAAIGIFILQPVRRIMGSKVALMSLSYLCLMALNVYYSRLIFPDSIVSAMLFGAITLHVLSEEKKSSTLACYVGILLGLTIVTGSYRIGPTLISLMGVFIFTLIKKNFEIGFIKRFAITLAPSLIIIYVFNKKFQFFTQIRTVLTASALTRDKDLSKLQPDFLFFIFVLAISTPFLVITATAIINRLKSKKSVDENEFSDPSSIYFTRLMWTLLLAPIIFHTFYYLRAPKVLSASLPALAILMAAATVKIKNQTLRVTTFVVAICVSITQCYFVLSGMGVRNSTAFYTKLASLEGVVSYGNALVVKSVTPFNPAKTSIVLGWDCDWRPESCNPDYSVMSPTAYELLSTTDKKNWSVHESWDLKFVAWGSLLYQLETFDSSPKTILKNIKPGFFIESPLPWLILKKKTPNE